MKFLFSIFILLITSYSAISQTKDQVESITNDCGSELACIFKGCGEIFENIKDIDRCYYEILDTQKATSSASEQQLRGIYITCNMALPCITEECSKFADPKECSKKVAELVEQKGQKLKNEKVENSKAENSKKVERGKWSVQRSYSQMDDSKTVTVWLNANNRISGWPRKTVKPTLYIRCRENKTAIFINVEMSANPEVGNYNRATVRIRLDEGKPFKQNWQESTDNEALFAPTSINLAKKINKSKTMLFEFVPYNSDPQLVEFDVRGLMPYLTEIAEACNWKL